MKNVLLDRDGVLIREDRMITDPADVELLPGVIDGLRRFPDARMFIVTNQARIGRGECSRAAVDACNARLLEQLAAAGITITDLVLCPHAPEEHCACRKPNTGLWDQLQAKHQLIANDCVMIGNSDTDIAFGAAIGCTTVLVSPTARPQRQEVHPQIIVPDLPTLAGLLQEERL